VLIAEVIGEDSEADLIERLRKRDGPALALAYDRYGRVAYSLLVRITRDPALAEDLLQEVFCRIWTRARLFDPGRGSLEVWILSIARNLAVDYIRSSAGRFTRSVRPIEDCNFLYSTSGSGAYNFEIARLLVRAALSKLTFNQRRALELAYFEGLSQAEIAARLHQPLGTVKSWMRSGLSSMRTAIHVCLNDSIARS
jgi:RNA polymerase sigma-70 factor (ECF subfamily)